HSWRRKSDRSSARLKEAKHSLVPPSRQSMRRVKCNAPIRPARSAPTWQQQKPHRHNCGAWSMIFDTQNPDTHYQNGILSDLEATAIKRFKCGAGFGVIDSWIQQLTDGRGTTADWLNG